MKTKLLLVTLALLIGGSFAANAQLTTGKTSSKVIRTGNRAKAGDYGIYFGATSTMFQNAFNDDVSLTPLPLINFKYMSSNNFELRVGLETYKLKTNVNGYVDQDDKSSYSLSNKSHENTLTVYPGFAYHFSKQNLLDVYIGAEVPLGWDSYTEISETGGKSNTTYTGTKKSYVLGLGGFIGLQAYVADLPVAVGFEYGLSSRVDTGLKYKSETTVGNRTTTIYTVDATKIQGYETLNFNQLAARKGELGSQFRFTLSYYFK